MTKKTPFRILVDVEEERARRWRDASEVDERLAVLPSGRRLSALVRLELDAAAERILGIESREG